MKYYLKSVDKEEQLLKYGFQYAYFNMEYMIRYIPMNAKERKIATKGGYKSIFVVYRTIYYDRETKEIFAYNDYLDERIRMNENWICDLLSNDEIIKR